MHTMDYYSAIKRNEALIHSTTWMSLKNMILQQLLTSYVFYTCINVNATLSIHPTLPFPHSTEGSARFSVMT